MVYRQIQLVEKSKKAQTSFVIHIMAYYYIKFSKQHYPSWHIKITAKFKTSHLLHYCCSGSSFSGSSSSSSFSSSSSGGSAGIGGGKGVFIGLNWGNISDLRPGLGLSHSCQYIYIQKSISLSIWMTTIRE